MDDKLFPYNLHKPKHAWGSVEIGIVFFPAYRP